jgi:hypothetical protein
VSMQTWTNGTCDGCGQPALQHGYGDGGDCYESCAYCGWFSEDEDSYDLCVNANPDQALLIRMMNVINHLRGRGNLHTIGRGLTDLIDMMRVGHPVVYHYTPEGKWYGDERWTPLTGRTFTTRTEVDAWLREWEQECYRDGDTFPQKTRIVEKEVPSASLLKQASLTEKEE